MLDVLSVFLPLEIWFLLTLEMHVSSLWRSLATFILSALSEICCVHGCCYAN